MYRRIAATALLVALALPTAALAADPSPVAPAPVILGGAWEIVSIQTPGGSAKVAGKLAIGSHLTASVGCNAMSAAVTSFDGTHLTIGPIATTLIGCPTDIAQAESYLASVLGAGSLTFDGASLASSGGRIVFAASQPAGPIATPPPAGPAVDPATCAALLGSEWDLNQASAVPGSAGGSTGASGAGSSSSGSGGAGTSTGTGTVDQGPGGVVAEPPIEIASVVPVGPPMPLVPATAVPGPDVTTVTPPDAPASGAIPVDVIPLPLATPGASMSLEDACRALLAALRGGKGDAIPPGTAVDGAGSVAAPTAEHAASMALSSSGDQTGVFVAVGLGALVVALVVVLFLGRRGRTQRDPGATPPQ